MNKIYLDHAATSPVHPHVAEKMITTLMNPLAIHQVSILLVERRAVILDEASGENSIQRKWRILRNCLYERWNGSG